MVRRGAPRALPNVWGYMHVSLVAIQIFEFEIDILYSKVDCFDNLDNFNKVMRP